ncbi:GIY-YIG nuclease family protein [Flammeovirga pacifica]|uniref:Bacteriophage T5 Orf172 DNA-binding domain-containing protein n=1 Tax=Flammeovirga pacifica TaxID=915059 RepID=A0A1S1YU29_FLAPC|nr:GIY-YIG nuclease family protein [Flammeovirga pacifica]OHX64506.1 hypothetical protein NH26_23300 [Flammeovirga pacifica]
MNKWFLPVIFFMTFTLSKSIAQKLHIGDTVFYENNVEQIFTITNHKVVDHHYQYDLMSLDKTKTIKSTSAGQLTKGRLIETPQPTNNEIPTYFFITSGILLFLCAFAFYKGRRSIIDSVKSDTNKEINKKKKEHQNISEQLTKVENDLSEVRKELLRDKNLLADLELKYYDMIQDIEDIDINEYDHSSDLKSKLSDLDWKLTTSDFKGLSIDPYALTESKFTSWFKAAVIFLTKGFKVESKILIDKLNGSNYDKIEEQLIKLWSKYEKFFTQKNSDMTLDVKIDGVTPLVREIKRAKVAHAFAIKRQLEKEEQAAIKAQMREEAKAEAEFRKAQEDAAKEERIAQEAIRKFQKEMDKMNEEERAKHQAQLDRLNSELQEAIEKGERAISMAQQTKRGHVYIISNIGSFGNDVYKIGMTRRLEPNDRVKELSGASVPFEFDVHGMIFSENAPELENQLHKKLSDYQVNKVNPRKEFFKVSIDEIESAVEGTDHTVQLTRKALAIDYNETLRLLKKNETSLS